MPSVLPLTLFSAFLIAASGLWASPSRADAALAIGQTGNIASGGLAIGFAVDQPSMEQARQEALKQCRGFQGAPESTRALCKVSETFRKRCFAVALDPEDGTPGAGWNVAANKQAAETAAMKRCRDTAGSSRRQFCKIMKSQCDKS
jgi:hypothetical protein